MNAQAGGNSNAPAAGGQTSLADFILLNEEIAALVRARIPLESQLARLGRELPGTVGDLTKRIGQRLNAGDSLPDAVDAECADMPAAYRAVIVAGVESGQLGEALESLAETASRMEQLRRVTGVAALYPLVVIIVASLLFAMVLYMVVPNFDWLYQRHFGPFSYLAHAPRLVAAIAVIVPVAAIVFAARWWWRSARLGGVTSAAFGSLAWLPWVRRVYYWGQAATMADLLRMLIKRGLPLDRALRLSADAAGNAKIRAAANELAEEAERGQLHLREGEAPAEPRRSRLGGLRRAPFGSEPQGRRQPSRNLALPLLIRMALRHATNRRLLMSSLRQAASMYRERAVRAAEWHAEYLPIVLTIAIGGTLTLGFTLMVFWPYASMLWEVSSSNWR